MTTNKRTSLGQVVLIYNIDKSWPEADQSNSRRLLDHMVESLHRCLVDVKPIQIRHNLDPLNDFDPEATVIFNWCEGYDGIPWSDAIVAKDLEARGFIFTGANSRTLGKSVNKETVKRILFEAGVPTPPGRAVTHEQARDWAAFPAMVKPVGQHCSFGVSRASIAESRAELVRQICRLEEEFSSEVLVEPFIDGREFHVAVWGNRNPEALPPVELDYSKYKNMHDRLYTFESKFDPASEGWSGIGWLCPAPTTEELNLALCDVAVRAYRAMRCRDYARMDIRLWNGIPVVLDVNPNADLDPESVMPIAAAHLGFDYGQMTCRILECAAARLRTRNASRRRRQVMQEI
ncbi:MAG: D-alanine--D-alanine ligase family protein [bacterium]